MRRDWPGLARDTTEQGLKAAMGKKRATATYPSCRWQKGKKTREKERGSSERGESWRVAPRGAHRVAKMEQSDPAAAPPGRYPLWYGTSTDWGSNGVVSACFFFHVEETGRN